MSDSKREKAVTSKDNKPEGRVEAPVKQEPKKDVSDSVIQSKAVDPKKE